ncbi:iron chelate uptake ABC transporter family permease subunit [Xenorhabdus nematophila]|uniref:FecCD family ABC transporter permease n=1 Tax=Xenorhabdus nematophila TaxID=628 RepID=UPI000541BE6E|nr:iron chelate uptake ABC transporter family permease subunit [Xenorhabdus nematophila]CEF31805.1 Ferric enterobactin transport system permease protein FepG [Xenorhabdus nematophila str. Websteri]AYA39592.1 iron ABC transporter permease [Xenorhabdus nematophila]MBA0018157.1 iron chelate uptake ABC transporter family permease subunit [Xenorhabdus nematophila]MCB4424782.1 iron chelate uptake ABC transporter family permease subunit [Xenorhabdus nematophila]QNJ37241.1 iron chelate uptake ABC tran
MALIHPSATTAKIKTLRLGKAILIAPSQSVVRVIFSILLLIVVLFYLSLAMGREGMDNPFLLTETPYQAFILTELRLPRALVAIGAGITLALSGSLFQLTTRNALGSPDIIGVNGGAAVGIVVAMVVWPEILPVPLGALLGAILAVLLVYLGNGAGFGHMQANKIIISGIAIAALCMAFVDFAASNIRIEQAQQLKSLLRGSLASQNWQNVALISGMMLFIPILFWLGRQLNYTHFGNDVANTLGVPVRLIQIASILLAVVFATMSVLVVGPVAFVALSAPQIARRLVCNKGAALFCTALVGALLMLASDLITLMLPTSARLPVGVVTAVVGGVYLMYLLYAELRRMR